MTGPAGKTAAVALVTGATRGIGRAIAGGLAARGLRVAVHGRADRAAAEKACRELPGGGHAAFCADLEDGAAPESLMAAVLAHFGRIDVLVNNAGIYALHPPGALDYPAWSRHCERTLAVNLLAPARLSFLAARAMAAGGGGRVVALSSRGAFRGEPRAPAYGASKAGLNALSQSLAQAFAPAGVLFFVVAPGWVDTEMSAEHVHGRRREEILAGIPLGRVGTAEEIGAVATWLALDAPASMTGCIVDANGASYLRS